MKKNDRSRNPIKKNRAKSDVKKPHRVVLAKPDQDNVFYNQGILLAREGKYTEAIEQYQQTITLQPTDTDAHYNMGVAYASLGFDNKAQACFRTVIQINPQDLQAHNNLGAILAKQGQLQAALESYQCALAIDPNYPRALINMGAALNGLKRPKEAIDVFNKALKLDPENDQILNSLGVAYHEIGQIESALESFEAALRIDPQNAEVWMNLGLAHRKRLEIDEAIRCYHKAIHIRPDDSPAYANLAATLEESNRLDEAQQMIDKALQLDSDSLQANYLQAKLTYRQGNYQQALDLLESASAKHPTETMFSTFYSLLGNVLHKLGRFEDAFEAFQRANHLDSTSPLCKQLQSLNKSDLEMIGQMRRWFSAHRISKWNRFAVRDDCPAPIFLVGFPRSGTTLLEQILHSHSSVSTLDEKPTLNDLILGFGNDCEGFEHIGRWSDTQIVDLRQKYWKAVRTYIEEDRSNTAVVDKMPLNLIYLGVVNRLFPEAKIIMIMRHPLDVILSCFMQRFSINTRMYNFLSLKGTIDFYDLVMNLYLHYQQILPLNIHTIRYEDLLNDFKSEVQQLLSFLGIEWENGLQAYYAKANHRFISTPSYTEVVRPIHREALYRWKNYKNELSQAHRQLRRYIVRFGYEDTADAKAV